MATNENSRQVTRIAGEALTRYRFVRSGALGRVLHTAIVVNQFVDGIVAEDSILTADNVGIVVPDGGTAKVQAGGVITAGANVTTNASGQAVAAASTNAIVGTYIGSVSSAANDIIEIQFAHKGAQP